MSVKLNFDVIKGNSKLSPIVILHGLFGNRLNNRSMGRFLNEDLRRDIYLVDMRNHGKSPVNKIHTYDAMSQDIFRLIEEENLNKPILIGHSMGGKVAMECALRKSKLVTGLVVIENAPINTMPNTKFIQYLSTLKKICNGRNLDADKVLSNIEPNRFVRQFLLTMLQKTSKQNDNTNTKDIIYKSKLPIDILQDSLIKGNISQWLLDSSKYRYTGPSLFIRGEESDYVADDYLPIIGSQFPRFELAQVSNGTHFVNSEKPRECASLITDYIERVMI